MILLITIILGGYLIYRKTPQLLESTLSQKLGVPVTIDAMRFHAKSFEISHLTIANPPDSQLARAFSAKKIRFEAPYWNYFKPHIIVNKVQIDDVYVGIEFYDKKNTYGNWTKIIARLDTQNTEKNHPPEAKKKRTALIRHLMINNISIDLILKGDKVRRLSPIPQLEFHDINSEEGLPMDEITELIIQKLMEQISILTGIANIVKSVLFIPKEAAHVIFSPFKFLFTKPKRSNAASQPSQN